jgi:hypothetical protein
MPTSLSPPPTPPLSLFVCVCIGVYFVSGDQTLPMADATGARVIMSEVRACYMCIDADTDR